MPVSRLMLCPTEVLGGPEEVVCGAPCALTLTWGHRGLMDGAWQCRLISAYQNSLTAMHCRQGRVHPRAVIGQPCATHDIASGVTNISPVLGAVLMKLDEGWRDGHWHPKAGEGLCSRVPQMWENQLSTHRDPQSPPAMGSATLLHSCPSAPGSALCMHWAPSCPAP